MKFHILVRSLTLGALLLLPLAACASSGNFPEPPSEPAEVSSNVETAVFAGGCFWGIEGIFERVEGVLDAVSGYSGGEKDTAEYEIVSTGQSGHAESVQIRFDPKVVSFGTLLKIFFSVAHNPTELNYQGPDVGTQYRSAVFYTSPAQKKIATDYIRTIDDAHWFSAPIVTQVVPLKAFYPAEDYHQDFMQKHPNQGYIVYWDVPKIKALERTYPKLLKTKKGA